MVDLNFVEDALANVAPDWSVDLDGTYIGGTTLVLLPEGGDDANGPSFVISRENFGFKLDQLHWDEMHELGTYPALADVVTAVQMRLSLDCHRAAALSLTLH